MGQYYSLRPNAGWLRRSRHLHTLSLPRWRYDNFAPMAGANDERLEIGHVLFIDIVGYSRLLIEDQKERFRQLTAIVLATAQVRDSTNEQLVRLPTGDGMALVFRESSE